MVVLGVILLVVAAVAVVLAVINQRRWQTMMATDTVRCADLDTEAGTVRELGGGSDGFRKVCEVVGAAEPGPDGPLTAKLSGTPCVWYRYQIRRRYWETRRDSNGRTNRQQQTQIVADFSSPQPFRVTDDSGGIRVSPDGAKPDRPERVYHEFVADGSSNGMSLSVRGITLSGGGTTGTIGYEHEEWVIRPGTRLYVLGEVSAQGDRLQMGKPQKGRYVISTRSEAELTAGARRVQRICMAVAAVAAAGGIAAIVAGALG